MAASAPQDMTVETANLYGQMEQSIPDLGFHCPSAPEAMQMAFPYTITPYTLEQDEREGFTVKFEASDDAASISSITGNEFYVNKEESKKIQHSITFMMFGSTDTRLDAIYGPLDDDDRLTPDLIYKGTNGYCWTELATRRTSEDRSLRAALTEKIGRYRVALERRSTMAPTSLCVIVVGPNQVMSSLTLDQELVDMLCSYLSLAIDMASKLEPFGILQNTDTDAESLNKDLKHRLSCSPMYFLPVDGSDKQRRSMTREKLESCTSEPCDEGMVKASYVKAILSSLRKEPAAVELAADTAEEMYTNEFHTRTDEKSICPVPLLPLPVVFSDRVVTEDIVISTEFDDPLGKIWSEAMNAMVLGNYTEHIDSTAELEERLLGQGHLITDKTVMKLRYVVHIEVNQDDRMNLALQGIKAKKMKNHQELLTKREVSKQGFSWNAGTYDLDEFFGQTEYWFGPMDDLSPETIMCHEAANEALVSHQLRINDPVTSRLGRSAEIMSAIAMEMALSSRNHPKQKKGCESFFLKRLRDFPVWLLISPTRSGSHTFFSVMVPAQYAEDLIETPFRNLTRFGDFYASEFTSLNESKMNNMITADTGLMAMHAHFSDSYWNDLDQAREMTLISFAMFAHDKAAAEEVVTLLRYAAMESFRSSHVEPNPSKIIAKLPLFMRSRLQLWFTKCLVAFCDRRDLECKPIRGAAAEDDTTTFSGTNPFTLRPLQNEAQLLDCFYLGYAKNKNEGPEENVTAQLVKKIVSEERKLTRTSVERFGDESFDTTDLPHEFSKDHVYHAADCLRSYMSDRMGSEWHTTLTTSILQRMRRVVYDELATLKASSEFTDLTETVPPRTKAAIAVLELVDRISNTTASTGPADDVITILNLCIEAGGIYVDIFKKPQHGGNREIYVLRMLMRLMQKLVEIIGQVLCECIHFEVITHPKQKLLIPKAHKRESMRKFGSSGCVTYSAASDAKRWNQCHHTTKFAMFLCRIVDKCFHPLVVTCMNLWQRKFIALPPSLIQVMQKNRGLMSHDPEIEIIGRAYSGDIETTWLAEGGTHLTCESGMMQGLLHYISSAFHAGCLLSRKACLLTMANHVLPGLDVIHSHCVSSDDSAEMISFQKTSSQTDKAKLFFILHMDTALSTMPCYGILVSVEKTTTQLVGCVEFNSVWTFGLSVFNPTIKFCFAANHLPKDESLISRQEGMYNLVQAYVENGGSFRAAHKIQLAQLRLFYKILGSSVSKAFRMWLEMCMRVKDPSSGFFLLDHANCTGLPGLNYNYYLVAKSGGLSSLLRSLMDSADLTASSKGTVSTKATVQSGDRKKWSKVMLRARNTAPSDWREQLCDHPETLYSRPLSVVELKCKIMLKLSNPMVYSSLSRNDSVTSLAASAIYVITHRSVSVTKFEFSERVRELRSLWEVLTDSIGRTHGEWLNESQLSVLFPCLPDYRVLSELLTSSSKWVKVRKTTKSRHYAEVKVCESHTLPELSLEKCVKWKWYNTPPGVAISMVSSQWERFKEILPWLRDTHDETVESSQSEDAIALRNIIARQTESARHLRFISSSSRNSSMFPIRSIMERNHSASDMLLSFDRRDVKGGSVSEALSLALKVISRVVVSPAPEGKRESICLEILNEVEVPNIPMVHDDNLERFRLMCAWFKEQQTYSSGLNLISGLKASGRGVFGMYSSTQTFNRETNEYEGIGRWVGHAGRSQVIVIIKNVTMIKISVSNYQNFKDAYAPFRAMAKTHNWNPSREKRVSGTTVVTPEWDMAQTRGNNSRGTPVVESSNMSGTEALIAGKKLRISIVSRMRNSMMRIVTTGESISPPRKRPASFAVQKVHRPSTVCSVRLNPEMGNVDYEAAMRLVGRPVLSKWVAGMRLTSLESASVVRVAIETKDDFSREVVSQTLFGSLVRHRATGKVPEFLEKKEKVEPFNEDDYLTFLQSDIDLDALDRELDEIVEEDFTIDDQEAEVFVMTNELHVDGSTFLRQHPQYDSLIEGELAKLSREDRTELSKGRLEAKHKDSLLSDILDLAGVKYVMFQAEFALKQTGGKNPYDE